MTDIDKIDTNIINFPPDDGYDLGDGRKIVGIFISNNDEGSAGESLMRESLREFVTNLINKEVVKAKLDIMDLIAEYPEAWNLVRKSLAHTESNKEGVSNE